jgi:hypothetical protein
MNGTPTVVRLFVPCSEVRCDITVSPNRYTLIDPFFSLRPPDVGYPFLDPELWLFCQLADATGVQEFVIDLSWDVEATVQQLHQFRVNMGTDRLAVRNFAVRITNLPFLQPGVYEFRLRSGIAILARATVRLEEEL